MYSFPSDSKKLSATIKRYEKSLQQEIKKYGFIDDGMGKRYLLGPMYLLKGDLEGALKSFNWFEKEFNDDIGEPGHLLCWTLALYKSGDIDRATRKLVHTMLMNLYVFPHLFGQECKPFDMWHSSTYSEQGYVQLIPSELFGLWDKEAKDWAKRLYESEGMKKIRNRYIEIFKQLKSEPVGPKRSQLVKEASTLKAIDIKSV